MGNWQRFYTVILRLLAGIPIPVVNVLVALFGWAAWVFARKDKATLMRNIHAIYGLPAHSHFAKIFGQQVARHQSAVVFESVKGVLDGKSLSIEGREELDEVVKEALAPGKGMIIITAHLGSWELVGYCVARSVASACGLVFHVLAKPPTSHALMGFLTSFRRAMGTAVLWSDKKSLLRDMLSVLKGGGALGFVMDQKPVGRQGPVVPFMGRPTAFVAGPATLAIRTGAAVVSVFCIRIGSFRYRLYARCLVKSNHGYTDLVALTEILSTEIEKYIRLFPEQWTWNYRRWRMSELNIEAQHQSAEGLRSH